MITGPACSVASIGKVITPLGKAVALSPSTPGRATDPPELSVRTSALRPAGPVGRTDIWKVHKHPSPSAGTKPGTIWLNALTTTSGTKCPTIWCNATGEGWTAFTVVPSGAVTSTGARDAALLGVSGAIATFSA